MKQSKLWPMLTLIALALLLSAANPNVIRDSTNQGQRAKTNSQDEQPEANPPAIVLADNKATTQPTAESANTESYNYHGAFNYVPANTATSSSIPWDVIGQVATVISTVALAFFTLGLWITSNRQWREINRQATAAEDQVSKLQETLVATQLGAEAAKKSADTAEKSLNDLERPWVFVSIETLDGWSRLWPASAQVMNLKLKWTFCNYGRSPAFLLGGSVALLTTPPMLPDEPIYKTSDWPNPMPLSQGVIHNREATLQITPDLHQQLVTGNSILMFYGTINYRDTLQRRECVSRWIAKFTVSRLQMIGHPDSWWTFEGPPPYTEYT